MFCGLYLYLFLQKKYRYTVLRFHEMKIKALFLLYLFLYVSPVVLSPTVDFQIKFSRIRKALAYLEKTHYEMEFTRFINDLGHNESLNNWLCINRIGCFGEWQFTESTLHCLGYKHITLKKFRKNPEIFPREMQRSALESLIRVNLALLQNYEHYIGDTIKGVVITKSGLIAAAHLGGAGSTRKFLKSNGKLNGKDAFGTSISDYLRKFRNYDIE